MAPEQTGGNLPATPTARTLASLPSARTLPAPTTSARIRHGLPPPPPIQQSTACLGLPAPGAPASPQLAHRTHRASVPNLPSHRYRTDLPSSHRARTDLPSHRASSSAPTTLRASTSGSPSHRASPGTDRTRGGDTSRETARLRLYGYEAPQDNLGLSKAAAARLYELASEGEKEAATLTPEEKLRYASERNSVEGVIAALEVSECSV